MKNFISQTKKYSMLLYMKSINYICSLGTQCHSASWIKQMKIKKCSFPFDWIFSNPKMIIDCIDNYFAKFLDRKLHVPHKNNKYRSDHKVYGSIFFHHNILEDTTYNYFVKCVDRFRILTKKEQNKLFILSSVNQKGQYSKEYENNIINLYKKLVTITINFDLLVVYHIIGTKLESEIVNLNENVKIIVITTKSLSTGVRFRSSNENKFYNDCIFKLYDFKIIDDIK